MDRSQITNLLNILKTTTDKNVMLRGLHKLRTEAVTDNEGISFFRESKGIPVMVRLLGKPKEEILEIALSILANCCSDKACCEEAFECRVDVNLVAILKSIPNPVIQCRACRLLGNLAKINAKNLLQHSSPTIAKSLCQIVQDTSDVSTRVMAIRAARYLITDPKFLKYFLHSNGFSIIVQILTSIMRKSTTQDENKIDKPTFEGGLKKNQHREKYFEEVARSLESVRSDIFDREVLKYSEQGPALFEMPTERAALDLSVEIIKCLSIMSDMEMALPVWTSLNQRGCNLSAVTFFASEQCKYRAVALRILANFAKNPEACYLLSNSNAVTAACNLLLAADMEKPLTESEIRFCLNILGQLSVDSCNRSKIRRSGAIRKLIMMLRESKSQVEISYIFQLLNNFQYDNMSMELMLKEGLIPILVRELYNYLTSSDEYHKKRREERQDRSKKRKLKIEAVENPKCKVGRLSDDYVCEFESPSCSPLSCFSPSSPCSSRSISPLFRSEGNEEEASNEDETYSPVCSSDDDEDEISESEKEGQENDSTSFMKLFDAVTTRSPDNTDDEKDADESSQDVLPLKSFGNMPRSTIDIIENLIFRVTLLVNKRPELGKAETLSTLIKAINTFGSNNNFVGALTNILLESQFFAQTVKHGITHQIYQLTKRQETRVDGFAFLETLTCVGESNYGKAELVRLLRSDDCLSQKRAAITVAYIIKDRKMLYQFLSDGNALHIILNILLNGDIEDMLTSEAADAITSLSQHTLNINIPIEPNDNTEITVSKEPEERSINENLRELDMEYDMRFLLQETETSDPIIVQFNKQLLCDSSEVFDTMFNSSFREGSDNEVRLQNYTVCGLEYFLNLIISAKRENPVFHLPPTEKYYALLEAYEMSRIYNLPPLESMGRRMLIQLLDEQNCLQVLEWSIKNNHPELMEYAINYYLCSMLPTENKVKLFRATHNSNCAAEWLEMIMDAILCRCQASGF